MKPVSELKNIEGSSGARKEMMNKYLISLIFIGLISTNVVATDYYVSPAGNDANSCQTPDSNDACRQIRRALQLLQAGDRLLIADGEYLGFTVQDLHGTAQHPIEIVAQGNDVEITPTTDRESNVDNIIIINSSYLVIEGMKTYQASRAGMFLEYTNFITVRKCVLGRNKKWGVLAGFSENVVFEQNIAYGSEEQHGIYVSNSADKPRLSRNRVFGNAASGIQLNADVSLGGDGIISGALIDGNVIYENGFQGGAGINLDGVQDSVIRNNVLYGNHATGIAFFREDGAEGSKNIKVLNNTIEMSAFSRWAVAIKNTSGAIELKNNIILARSNQRGVVEYASNNDVLNTTSDHNLYAGNIKISPDKGGTSLSLADWQSRYPESEKRTITEKKLDFFIDAANNGYRLKVGSRAINAGARVADNANDILGNFRPLGASYDIGAHEYVEAFSELNADATYYNIYTGELFLPVVQVADVFYEARLQLVQDTGDDTVFKLITAFPTQRVINFPAKFDPNTGLVFLSRVDLLQDTSLVSQYAANLQLVAGLVPLQFDLVGLAKFW